MTRALVVFQSMFGNTQQIVEAVREGLSSYALADILAVGTAPDIVPDDIDLIVVGGPTHALGMSRPRTRGDASRQAGGRIPASDRSNGMTTAPASSSDGGRLFPVEAMSRGSALLRTPDTMDVHQWNRPQKQLLNDRVWPWVLGYVALALVFIVIVAGTAYAGEVTARLSTPTCDKPRFSFRVENTKNTYQKFTVVLWNAYEGGGEMFLRDRVPAHGGIRGVVNPDWERRSFYMVEVFRSWEWRPWSHEWRKTHRLNGASASLEGC